MAWKQWWNVRAEEGGSDGGSAAGSVETPKTTETSPTDGGGESSADASKQDAEGEAASKQSPDPKGRDRLNKRFSELTRTIYAERDRADAAERENAELRRRVGDGGGEAQKDEAPKLSDFKEYEEYADARSRWVARQELRRVNAQARESASREAALSRATEIRAKWEGAETSAREKYDDYDEVMAGSVRFPEAVAIALLDSDRGPEISYYLKTHPEEVAALRGLTPVAAARVIGRLESKLDTPPEKSKSSAPPPPKPTRASAPTDELAGNLSDSEWIRRRNKQELDRRRNG